MNEEPESKEADGSGSKPTPKRIHLCQRRPCFGAKPCGKSLSLFGSPRKYVQSGIRGRKSADFSEAQSKIHCLAAVLNFCNACALGASE